jgi:DNA polymerase-1
MIKALVGKQPKILVLYDSPQHPSWIKDGQVGITGIAQLVRDLMQHQVKFENVAVCCLSDDPDGKAKGYKDKVEYISELVSTLAPNVVLLPTSKSFEKFTAMKGASKFYNKPLISSEFNCKCIAIPSYSAVTYNPNLTKTILEGLVVAKREMEYPELREAEKPKKNFFMLDTMDKFERFYKFYSEKVFEFAIDIETDSLQFNNGKILSIQFSHAVNFGYFIPTNDYHGKWTESEWAYIVQCINNLVEDDRRMKCGANIYFDLKFLNHHFGTKLVKINVFDVLVSAFLVDDNREQNSLKYLAATLTQEGDYERELLQFKAKHCKETKTKLSDFQYSSLPLDLMQYYACMDVSVTIELVQLFKQQLKLEEQEEVFWRVMGYAWALAMIEKTGWKVDLVEAERYKKELEDRIATLREELKVLPEIQRAVTGLTKQKLIKENEKRKNKITELKESVEFLVNSVNHKRYLFKDLLKFPEVKKTKKGMYATDKECFEIWFEKYPEVQCLKIIKEIEELTKMLNTYVKAILTQSVNSRLHCSYRVTGAKTGRISAVKPAMQTISQHSEEAAKLKKCFIVDEGHTLCCHDLSNAELRITAAVTGDPVLTQGFIDGVDPHSNTAKAIFKLDCPVEDIKEKHNDYRQLGKMLGFASLYGASPSLIAKRAKIPEEEAEQLLKDYFSKHAGIRTWMDENIKFAREHGYVLAPSGRKRRVPHIHSEDRYVQMRAERQANNSIIQSLASDAVLDALVAMWEEIEEKNLPYRIVNIIHDSTELEIPDELVPEALQFVKRHMERFPAGVSAPFKMLSDAEIGKTWADVKKVKVEEKDFEDLLDELDNEDETEEEAA